jgi:formylglycine-generating enzyme required for sulfatase activity
MYAGLSITGAVGTVYSMEYVTDLAQTNNASAWRCLEFLQLPASPYLWADKSAPATGKRFYRAVAMEAPANMVFIPPGTFRMGSPTNEVDRYDWEGPQTAVTISRGFWMGKYEVTQGEYLAVMGSNPSYFQPPNATADTNRPVETVTWYDATAYCDALTQRERLAGRIGTNSVYRLPTEAEWEYACRAWTSTRFSYGDDPGYTNLTNYAWYFDNSGGTTHPVGQKLPNPWGLYDMHGNVWEWCQDWIGGYAGGIAVDPRGLDTGSNRVIRGGRWGGSHGYAGAWGCRSADRGHDWDYLGIRVGFRVVLAPGQP